MSQQLQLLVGGLDLTNNVVQDGWSIAQNWSRQGDTASFILTDEHLTGQLTFTIAPLMTVVLKDVGLNQTLFSGLVPKPQMKRDGPNLCSWQLDCVDWTYMSDRQLVVGDYSNMTADQLAILITTQANCGITAATPANGGFVQSGPSIPRIQFGYDTLTAAWTKISKVASLTTTYGWYVDENRALHFYTISQAPASGWTLSDNVASLNTTSVQGYNADTFAYEWDATSIRNTVTVRGADYSQTQTDLFVGNGSQGAWPLTFVPDANNVSLATLTVGGVTKTVSAQTGGSATTQWVIVGNGAGQWFLAANTDPIPASPTIIQFGYPYLQPVVSQTSDPTSIARFQSLPNGGVFAYYIPDTSLPTLLAAQKRGQREVATYSQPTERAQVDTTEDFTGHFRAGQTIQLVSSLVPDSQAAMAPGINAPYLILQCRINGEQGLLRVYQVTAARVG
jgi:hypothetical protein